MAESAPSTTTTFLVKPSGPTLLDGVSELPIDGLDVFGYNAANSYVVPELLDVQRFNAALGKALRWFPLYAARVRCADGGGVPWVLTLPPQGIPVTLSSSPSTTIVLIEAIVQKPLSFLSPLSPREITRDPTTPLASILLTHFLNLGKTSIGITRWHPIGSDYVASRFIRLLSALYVASAADRDADALLEDEPKPVYAAARSYLPAPNAQSLQGMDTSALESYYRIGTTHPQLDASVPGNVRLDFRLSNAQMQVLRGAISSGQEQNMKLSAQDCLVALVAAATNAADPGTPPIHTISTILDVRGAAGVPSELSFNGFTFAPTDRVVVEEGKGQQETYLAYASAVRRSIVKARDPGFLSALVDLQARQAEEATARGEVMDLASGEGHMLVNSTLRLVLLDALMRPHIHFGHPGQMRSYVGTVPFVRHLKLARPNPSYADSPTTRLDAVEVTLYFQPHVRERFKQELEERLRSLGVLADGAVEWVEASAESSEQNR
ncbi:hypothetical protein R3P38DRAFT_2542578 [Favolaschia claudopus]|uniref:Uncharacterized protein n=1 Tax=Favolaschia claudopus TaxID=2862362 RepID=A0AAW0AS98_9AGAR